MLSDNTPIPREAEKYLTDATRVALPSGVEAASGTQARLVVIGGWEIGREVSIAGCPHVIGRSVSADTFVNAPSVSRRHAQVDREEDAEGNALFLISDLGSSNGTQVNGVPAQAAPLANGDKIRMGDVLFKFVLQDEFEAKFHQQVHRLIHYDQLTGLLTMEAFRARLDLAMRRGKSASAFSLAMTDLDGLKRVNDTHGHLAGRMVVREMGAMMRTAIRPQDLAGLYGGDEAIVLFTDAALEEAVGVADGLRVAIEERVFEQGGNTFQVTISQGLAEWPRHGKTAEELIAAADQALYDAKNAGRNCIRTAESDPGEVTQ